MAIWFALTVTMPTIVKVFKVTFAAIHCAVIFISDRRFRYSQNKSQWFDGGVSRTSLVSDINFCSFGIFS